MPNDTAKETFDIAIDRSRYLLRMATGLTNHRLRGARNNWFTEFKGIMRWKQSDSIDRVDSKDVVLVIRNNSDLSRGDFSTEKLDDLLRASLVMAVSAVDAYFHAKIIRYIASRIRSSSPPEQLMNAKISVSDFVEANYKERRNSVLRDAIERDLSFKSLQNPDKIAEGLALIGISNFWTEVAQGMEEDIKSLKNNIRNIIKRRNQIVHGADLSQSKKARNQLRRIQPGYVEYAIDTLEKVIEASEQVIESQLWR